MLSVKSGDQNWIKKTVDFKEHGEFVVHLKKPTWEQLSQDNERRPGFLAARLDYCVVGWEGVEVNGEKWEFTPEKFRRLSELVPAVFHLVSALVSDMYYSFGEDEAKNSDAASSGS